MTEEQLETHTIAAWREAKEQECVTDSNGRTYPQHLVHVSAPEQMHKYSTYQINFPISYICDIVNLLGKFKRLYALVIDN